MLALIVLYSYSYNTRNIDTLSIIFVILELAKGREVLSATLAFVQ